MTEIATQSLPTAIHELDSVRLLASIALEEGRLQVGDQGTVVHRYRNGDAFEVEFVHPLQALLTLRPGEIERVGG